MCVRVRVLYYIIRISLICTAAAVLFVFRNAYKYIYIYDWMIYLYLYIYTGIEVKAICRVLFFLNESDICRLLSNQNYVFGATPHILLAPIVYFIISIYTHNTII